MITDRTASTGSPNAGADEGPSETERLLRLLDAAILMSRRSRREIERKLGWSQGYLGSLLRGRIGLKVWHVFALARELGIEPLSLFLTVAPPHDPSWILLQLGINPAAPETVPSPIDEGRRDLSRDELEEMMRTLLRQELERFGLLEPAQVS
jgi:hypothetical protein